MVSKGYNLSGCTIGESEVEVELLVAEQLVGGGIHGEHPEGGIAPGKGSDGRTQEHSAIDPALVLHLSPTQTNCEHLIQSHCKPI